MARSRRRPHSHGNTLAIDVGVDSSPSGRLITETSAPPDSLPFAEAPLRAGYKTLTYSQISSTLGGLGGTNFWFNLPNDGSDYLIDMGWTRWNRALKIGVNSGQRVHTKNVYIDVDKPVSLGAYGRGGFGYRHANNSSIPGHLSLTGCLITGTTLADGLTIGITSASYQIPRVTYQKCRVESRSLRLGRGLTYPGDEPGGEHLDAFQMQGPVTNIEFGLCTFYCCNVLNSDPGKGMMLNSYLAKNEIIWLDSVNFRDDASYNEVGTGSAWIKDDNRQTLNLTNVWARKYGSGPAVRNWYPDDTQLWGRIFYQTIYQYNTPQQYTTSGTKPNRIATFPNTALKINGFVSEGLSDEGDDFCTRADLAELGWVE